jgi:GNAT superfamily N-acetyltransferase
MRYSAAAEVHEADGLFRWRTPVPHAWFNGVLCDRPPGADADAEARAAIEYFRSHGTAAFTWWLSPQLQAEEWSPHLLRQGYGFDQQTPGMALDLAEVPATAPSSLEIRRVVDRESLRSWVRAFVAGYGAPESWAAPMFELYQDLHDADSAMRSYLGYRKGEPVATSTMFLGAGVAGIYDVATLPSARGQGIGSEMTLAPLREARAESYRVGILQSSAMGLGIYEKLGFRTVCAMEHFFWRAE